jgi:cytochrome c oxidase assembly protein Cox11
MYNRYLTVLHFVYYNIPTVKLFCSITQYQQITSSHTRFHTPTIVIINIIIIIEVRGNSSLAQKYKNIQIQQP